MEDLFLYGNDRPLYGWFISDLVVYENPIQLDQFGKHRYGKVVPWIHPPISWGYCVK
jgi:hypothetical protein